VNTEESPRLRERSVPARAGGYARSWEGVATLAVAVFSLLLVQCSSDASSARDGGSGADATSDVPCNDDWACAVDRHCEATATTLTGRVFDPAGTTPLYGVLVSIPRSVGSIPRITPGTNTCSCQPFIEPTGPVQFAFTDAQGAFTMPYVPTGRAVPVTVQIGKWRRTVYVNVPTSCAVNTVPDGTLRLPRSRSEGDMPQMAIVTGGSDDLGCSLRRIGIDPREYSAPHAGGRLDVYRGVAAAGGTRIGTGPGLSSGVAGDCTTASCPLWASKAALEQYDMVLLSCEGDPYMASKPPSAINAMHDWLNEGGRVFATHSQAVWFQDGASDFQGVAGWKDFSAWFGSGSYSIGTASYYDEQQFDSWLSKVDAASGSAVALGSVSDSVASSSANADVWIYDRSSSDLAADAALAGDPKILSFETPVGGVVSGEMANQHVHCGQVVFTDVHAGAAPSGDLPGACQMGVRGPEEKALEFFFFYQPDCARYPSRNLHGPGPPK
jgi:hypothetical protein